MSISRKGVGGRKPVNIPNPFVVVDTIDDEEIVENVLWSEDDTRDINIEDIIVGIVRSFNADEEPGVSEIVDSRKVLRIYSNVNEITRQSVQDYLRCSESQAKRYIQVIKACNPFIQEHSEHPKTGIGGYRNVSKATFKYHCHVGMGNS